MTAPRPVRLAAYDPRWPEQARIHGDRLRALGEAFIAVHHVGSTAVPGLAAKPVIDLLVEVSSLAALDSYADRLRDLGYRLRGENGIRNRLYFTLDGDQGGRRVHVHAFAAGDPEIRRHLALRDYLRAHPEIARAYAAEKERAQSLHPEDSRAYSAEKSAWIMTQEAQALRWYDGVTG